jgi:dolichyl-phosphate-mannose--protein O-mannosyl transferase
LEQNKNFPAELVDSAVQALFGVFGNMDYNNDWESEEEIEEKKEEDKIPVQEEKKIEANQDEGDKKEVLVEGEKKEENVNEDHQEEKH